MIQRSMLFNHLLPLGRGSSRFGTGRGGSLNQYPLTPNPSPQGEKGVNPGYPMFRVTKELKFCFGHRLMDYDGKCRNLHGHNARVAVTVESAKLDAHGMVRDFSALRREIGDWIDATLDHKMILHERDPFVRVLRELGDPVLTLPDHPTTENLAKFIYEHVRSTGYPVVEVTLWETPTSSATYAE